MLARNDPAHIDVDDLFDRLYDIAADYNGAERSRRYAGAPRRADAECSRP